MFQKFQNFLDGPLPFDNSEEKPTNNQIQDYPNLSPASQLAKDYLTNHPDSLKNFPSSTYSKQEQPSNHDTESAKSLTPDLHQHLQIPTVVNLSLIQGSPDEDHTDSETKQQDDIKEELQLQDVSPQIKHMKKNKSRSRSRRANSTKQFLEYQQEWLKLKEAKLQSSRELQQTQLLQKHHSAIIPNLPLNYKGPCRGYYEQVGRYFELKLVQKQLKDVREKPKGHPSVLDFAFKNISYLEQLVEDRLIKKGVDYQQKREQLQQELIRIDSDPSQYRPTLVAQLKANSNKDMRHGTHESLYLDGIKGMIRKQEKILNYIQEIETKPRMPQLSEKSRELAKNRTFDDLLKVPESKVIDQKPTTINQMTRSQLQAFLQRNYNQLLKAKQHKQEKIEQQKQKEIEVAKSAVVAPCEGSVKIYNQKVTADSKRDPIFVELYKQAKKLKDKQQYKIEKRKQELESKEVEGLTSKPKINSYSQAFATFNVPSHHSAPKAHHSQLKEIRKVQGYQARHHYKQAYHSGILSSTKKFETKGLLDNLSAIGGVSNSTQNSIQNKLLQQKANSKHNLQAQHQLSPTSSEMKQIFGELGQESQNILLEAQRAISEFDLSTQRIITNNTKEVVGLITPPAHVQKTSPSISQNNISQDSGRIQSASNSSKARSSNNNQPSQKQWQDKSHVSQISPQIMQPEYFVRDLDFGDSMDSQFHQQQLGVEYSQTENSLRMLDAEGKFDSQNSVEQTSPDYPTRQMSHSSPQTVPIIALDSRVNRSLSAIQEDYELEDDMSQLLSKTSGIERRGSKSPNNLSSTGGKFDCSHKPKLVQELETTENEFNLFLEKLYT